ncbi:MAG: Gfo/Idh/MocA family oxidoreductase [Bacteroidales bacterium]|jgi:predicted dehydrogenase|nr:Gfo/Idh/MocA family oxidoreductase [Bacteroidales bacterium]
MKKGIGIIGCGKIAQIRHIPELAGNPDAVLVGYYNPTRMRAEQMAARYGGKVYDDIPQMLADPDVDAVVISLANKVHAEVTIQALQAGKDVLCEKPMATTLADCEAMVETAERQKRLLLIAQNQRLAQAHREARKLIADGAIGRVLTFRTTFGHAGPETWSIRPGKDTWFFSRDKAAMGVMADLGIHKTDLIQYLLGKRVTGVSALLSTLDKTGPDGAPIGVEDNALCLFRMEGGLLGTMTASWTYYGEEDNSTIIYGTEGILRIYDDPQRPLQWIGRDGNRRDLEAERIQTNDNQTASGVADAFLRALITREPGEMAARSVLPAMRAVFAAQRSSDEGRFIEIPENE